MAAKKKKSSAAKKSRAASPKRAVSTKSAAAKKKGAPAKKKGAAKKKPARKKPAAKKSATMKSGGKKPVAKSAARPAKKSKIEVAADARVNEIQRIIDVMTAAGAVEVELEEAGCKLRVRLRDEQVVSMMPMAAQPAMSVMAPLTTGVAGPVPVGAVAEEPAEDPNRNVFKSPMVGTFYTAASPDAEPFVHVGTRINEDSTLCILEAMKVMNEIKAETHGEVLEILVQNGEAVEFGQPLFVIKS